MGGASGRDGNKGEAVESLWAAVLEGSLTMSAQSELHARYEETSGGAPFTEVAIWLRSIAGRFPLRVRSAERTPMSVNGDVDALLADGSMIKFEVKAQVKKDDFNDITQSDWVRDQTDLLSRLTRQDHSIHDHFTGFGARALQGVHVDPEWSTQALHVADLAGITNAGARRKAEVRKPADLKAFVERKWFLHVTNEGARLCRFDDIVPIKHLLSGGDIHWKAKLNNEGRALRSLSATSGATWFTYHLYPGERLKGRHKIHPPSFEGVRWI